MIQNYTTFSLTDANNRYTVTASRIVFSSLTDNEYAFAIKDFGVSFFNTLFTHNFDFNLDSASATSGHAILWAVSNYSTGILGGAGKNSIYATSSLSGNDVVIALYSITNSTLRTNSLTITSGKGNTYYASVNYDPAQGSFGKAFLRVYSDSARTTQVGSTVTLTFPSAIGAMRYLYGALSVHAPTTNNITGYVENLNLNLPDVVKPVITLLGDSETTIIKGQSYIDAGATAVDDEDGDITGEIVVSNPVDSNTIGDYTITYNVSDSSDNAADEVTRLVHVEPSDDAVVTSNFYTIESNIISGVRIGTQKTVALAYLKKNNIGQTWNSSDIHDPIQNGDVLRVTAEDGTTKISYSIRLVSSNNLSASIPKYNIQRIQEERSEHKFGHKIEED